MQSRPLKIVRQKASGPGSPGNNAPTPVTAMGGIRCFVIYKRCSSEAAWRHVEEMCRHIDAMGSCLLGPDCDRRAFHDVESDLRYTTRLDVGQESVAHPFV